MSEPEQSGGERHCGLPTCHKSEAGGEPPISEPPNRRITHASPQKRSRKRAPSKASPQTAVQPNSEPAPITTHQYHQDWEEQVMRVSICIGSACHLRGSREIIQKLQTLVKANNISDKVDLNGAFCSGSCVNGACVTIDGELFSLSPETTEEFFNKEIMRRL